MIAKRLFLAAGLLSGVLFVPASAAAEAPAEPPSPQRLKAALLTPQDIGAGFTRVKDGDRESLIPENTHTQACTTAINGIAPLYQAKAATWLENEATWESVHHFIVSGTRSEISELEQAAKAMVRHCRRVTKTSKHSRLWIRELRVGELGDGAYGIRFRDDLPNATSIRDSMVTIDIVVIRVRNTMLLLEHTGHIGQFDTRLTKSAAEIATKRLQKLLKPKHD